jgi:hypothetical protein
LSIPNFKATPEWFISAFEKWGEYHFF